MQLELLGLYQDLITLRVPDYVSCQLAASAFAEQLQGIVQLLLTDHSICQ
jgi:hypothetical protein